MKKILIFIGSLSALILMSGFGFKVTSAKHGRIVVGPYRGYLCSLKQIDGVTTGGVNQQMNQQVYSGKLPVEFTISTFNQQRQAVNLVKDIFTLEKYGSDTDYFSRKWNEPLSDGQMPTTLQWITSKNKIIYFKNNKYNVCEFQ